MKMKKALWSVNPDYSILSEQSTTSSSREIYNRAPGENKDPASQMAEKLCEELAFPVLFSKGRLAIFYCRMTHQISNKASQRF